MRNFKEEVKEIQKPEPKIMLIHTCPKCKNTRPAPYKNTQHLPCPVCVQKNNINYF